jgi:hypothetical protein
VSYSTLVVAAIDGRSRLRSLSVGALSLALRSTGPAPGSPLESALSEKAITLRLKGGRIHYFHAFASSTAQCSAYDPHAAAVETGIKDFNSSTTES